MPSPFASSMAGDISFASVSPMSPFVAGMRIERRYGYARIFESPPSEVFIGDANGSQDVVSRDKLTCFRKRFMSGEMHTSEDAADEHGVHSCAVGQAFEDFLMSEVRCARDLPRFFIHGRGDHRVDFTSKTHLG